MRAREEILGRVRSALEGVATADPMTRAYRRTTQLSAAETVERFAARVDDYRATVHRTDERGLAATLARIVNAADVGSLAVPADLPDVWLARLDRSVTVRRVVGHDVDTLTTVGAALTGASAGIADTGTLVLDGGAGQGTRALTLVPDHHLCVIRDRDVVATVPEGLARLDPHRPITLISGPSATSDIELDRVEGVHGPRVLDVIIVSG